MPVLTGDAPSARGSSSHSNRSPPCFGEEDIGPAESGLQPSAGGTSVEMQFNVTEPIGSGQNPAQEADMHSNTTGTNDEFTIDLVLVENVAAPAVLAWLKAAI